MLLYNGKWRIKTTFIMDIPFYIAIILLTIASIELLTGRAIAFSGLINRHHESTRYWKSIIVQSVLIIGLLVIAAFRLLG